MTPLEILLKKEPYIQLTVEDDSIYAMHFDRKSNPAMALIHLKIIEKLGYKYNSEGKIDYQFELNSITDPVWRELLTISLGATPPTYKIEGNKIAISSSVETIAKDFEAMKSGFAKANTEYRNGRNEVLQYAKKQDEERAKKSAEKLRIENERRNEIQTSYAALKID